MENQYKMEVQDIKTIFHNLPIGVCVSCIDEKTISDSIIMIVNDTFCQMTGYSRRELIEIFDNRFGELICKEDQEKYEDAIFDLYEFPQSITLRYRIRKKNGATVAIIDKMQSVRHSNGEMLLYSCLIEDGTEEPDNVKSRVEIRTFDRFEVFVDGQPVIFHSEKAKELLALLVDRRGSYVSNREIITHLWEDELVDPVTQSRCRKVVFNLKNTLQIYGIEDILESKIKGYRRLAVEKVNCDLYQYLSGDEKYAHLFQGSYMEEYFWSEVTLSRLVFEREGR